MMHTTSQQNKREKVLDDTPVWLIQAYRASLLSIKSVTWPTIALSHYRTPTCHRTNLEDADILPAKDC